MRPSLAAVPTLVAAIALIVAGCGFEPTPAPPTSSPIAELPSPTPTPTPTPVSLPTPIIAASIDCARDGFNPPATLQCNEAVDVALAALPMDHAAVLNASFLYRLPCAPNKRCGGAMSLGNSGFVIITSGTGDLEVVRVTEAADGTMTTEGPEPYSPPSAATRPTVKVGEWTATCLDVPTSDCTGIAGLFVNNLARSGQSILEQSGGRLAVWVPGGCPAMPVWVDGTKCWQVTTDVTDRQICMVIARQTISSPFGFAQVGGDEMSGRAVPPVGFPECV